MGLLIIISITLLLSIGVYFDGVVEKEEENEALGMISTVIVIVFAFVSIIALTTLDNGLTNHRERIEFTQKMGDPVAKEVFRYNKDLAQAKKLNGHFLTNIWVSNIVDTLEPYNLDSLINAEKQINSNYERN